MYSGTVASYRYGRTIRGHYPYVAPRQSIWTAQRQVPAVPVTDRRSSRGKQAERAVAGLRARDTELLGEVVNYEDAGPFP